MWPTIILVIILLLLAAKVSGMPFLGSYNTPTEKLAALASAVAQAEGWNVVGSLPQRSNNPGALRVYGETGTITTFGSPTEGWNALYKQLDRILTGQSPYYSLGMSFWQMAQTWTGGDNPEGWAITVATALGVSPDATLREYLEV